MTDDTDPTTEPNLPGDVDPEALRKEVQQVLAQDEPTADEPPEPDKTSGAEHGTVGGAPADDDLFTPYEQFTPYELFKPQELFTDEPATGSADTEQPDERPPSTEDEPATTQPSGTDRAAEPDVPPEERRAEGPLAPVDAPGPDEQAADTAADEPLADEPSAITEPEDDDLVSTGGVVTEPEPRYEADEAGLSGDVDVVEPQEPYPSVVAGPVGDLGAREPEPRFDADEPEEPYPAVAAGPVGDPGARQLEPREVSEEPALSGGLDLAGPAEPSGVEATTDAAHDEPAVRDVDDPAVVRQGDAAALSLAEALDAAAIAERRALGTDTLVQDDLPAEPEPARQEARPRTDRMRSGIEWVAVIVGALVVALVVKTFLFQAFYIPSASMEPTLKKGDRVLVNKLSYDLHDVNRGDVIVFELDPDQVGPDGIKDLIKRVIGLPGDVIETREGLVYVNDRALGEPYLAKGTLTGDPEDGQNPPIARQTVPEGHVYVLGDNRSNSADSRYPYRGPIPIESIVGRAFVLVWPPADIGSL